MDIPRGKLTVSKFHGNLILMQRDKQKSRKNTLHKGYKFR